MVPMGLSKSSGGEGCYPYSALIDLGATYNFISHFDADELRLEAVKAGWSKVKKKTPPPITTINGELLHSTMVVR